MHMAIIANPIIAIHTQAIYLLACSTRVLIKQHSYARKLHACIDSYMSCTLIKCDCLCKNQPIVCTKI